MSSSGYHLGGHAASEIFPHKFLLYGVPALVRCATAGTLFLIHSSTIWTYNKGEATYMD